MSGDISGFLGHEKAVAIALNKPESFYVMFLALEGFDPAPFIKDSLLSLLLRLKGHLSTFLLIIRSQTQV